MRASQSLLSAAALLFGALALGNPFLPRRGEVEAGGKKQPASGVAQHDTLRRPFVTTWQIAGRQQSPIEMLHRLSRAVTPTIAPALWLPPASARTGLGTSSEVGFELQRPQ